MRCVICLKTTSPEAFTEEHIFPRALGGTLTTKTVCKPCNDLMGHSVDDTLVNHGLMTLLRMKFDLRGRTGKAPNVLEHVTLSNNANPKLKYRFDPSLPRSHKFRALPHVMRSDLADGKINVHVEVDQEDSDNLGTILNKTLARAGAKRLPEDELERLKETAVARVESVRLNASLEFDVNHYRRGLIKIAYELACLWLGDSYLDDPTAKVLRDCMLDTNMPFDVVSQYPIRGNLPIWWSSERIMPFWHDEPNALIGVGMRQHDTIGVYVRVLTQFEVMIMVTDNPENYTQFEGQFVAIDSTTGQTRQSTFIEEIERMCSA